MPWISYVFYMYRIITIFLYIAIIIIKLIIDILYETKKKKKSQEKLYINREKKK